MASNTYTCLAEVALCCIPLHYPACQRKTIPRVRGKPHTASTVCFCWHPELAGLLQLNSSSKIFPAQCSLSRLWHWEGEGTHTRQRETIMLWVLQGCIDRGENIPQGKENSRQKKNYSRVGFAVSEVWGETGRKSWIWNGSGMTLQMSPFSKQFISFTMSWYFHRCQEVFFHS